MNMFVLALMRHVLTGLGVWVASKGYADAESVEQIVGAALTMVGVGMSIWDKKKLAG